MNIEKVIEESIKLEQSGNRKKTLVFDLEKFYDTLDLKRIKCPNQIKFISEQNVSLLSVNNLLEVNNIIDLIVKDIKSKKLSPYEEYIAAYNVARMFKEYRYYNDSLEDDQIVSDQSRNLYLILNNNWICCVGYVNFLAAILNKLKINCLSWVVETESEYHKIVLVNLVDEKYDIDGFYLADPTFDVATDITSPMIHLNMTFYEARTKQHPNYGIEYTDIYFDKLYDVKNTKMLNMYKNLDSTITSYDDVKEKIDKKIPTSKVIEASIIVYKTIYQSITDEELIDLRKKLLYDYDYLYDTYNHVSRVRN